MLIAASNPGLRSTYADSNFTISKRKATPFNLQGAEILPFLLRGGGSLRFNVYNGSMAEALTVLNTGNVWIGNTSPTSYKLWCCRKPAIFAGTVARGKCNVKQWICHFRTKWQRSRTKLATDRRKPHCHFIRHELTFNIGIFATKVLLVHFPGTAHQCFFLIWETGNFGSRAQPRVSIWRW